MALITGNFPGFELREREKERERKREREKGEEWGNRCNSRSGDGEEEEKEGERGGPSEHALFSQLVRLLENAGKRGTRRPKDSTNEKISNSISDFK